MADFFPMPLECDHGGEGLPTRLASEIVLAGVSGHVLPAPDGAGEAAATHGAVVREPALVCLDVSCERLLVDKLLVAQRTWPDGSTAPMGLKCQRVETIRRYTSKFTRQNLGGLGQVCCILTIHHHIKTEFLKL